MTNYRLGRTSRNSGRLRLVRSSPPAPPMSARHLAPRGLRASPASAIVHPRHIRLDPRPMARQRLAHARRPPAPSLAPGVEASQGMLPTAALPLALASASCPPAPNARQRPPQARQQWPCRGESGSEARSRTREPSKASSECAAAHLQESDCVNVSRSPVKRGMGFHVSGGKQKAGETWNVFRKPSAVACVCTVLAKPRNCCTCK